MALEATTLTFGYRPETGVLRGVTVSFAPGSLTAIVGPNGAGKSTLLRLLAGVLRPQQGGVMLDGVPVAAIKLRDRARRMAYVAQRPATVFAFTVRQFIGLGRFAAGEADDERAIRSALTAVDLTNRENEVFGALSAGQQQRASLARALAQLDLAHAPSGTRVLLLDEPVSALDPRHALQTLALLKDLAARGMAVVAVLHDLTLVGRYCDRAVVLTDDGTLAAAGPTAESLAPAQLESVFGVTFRRTDLGGDGAVVVPSLPASGR